MTEKPWENYATMIKMSGGFHQTRVLELLNVAGALTAGKRVVEGIERVLAEQRIGHFPTQLPRDQNACVLLYNQDLQGPGSLLHLVRQLTETGTSTNSQIITLNMLLHQLQPKPTEDVAPA